MRISPKEFRIMLRMDFAAFVERAFYELNPGTEYFYSWHIEAVTSKLEKCRAGEVRRLVINLPPRCLKSHIVSICFVAWLLGHNPGVQIICVSYGQDLSDKLARDCRTLMNARWYQELFPGTRLVSSREPVQDISTTARGFRFSTSVGGGLTGRGADFIIIDDPQKPEEAPSESRRQTANSWFDSILLSRLNDKRDGKIIIIQQRVHEDDLTGHVLQQGGWELLRFPAIAEEDEVHNIGTPYGRMTVHRRPGEALHPEREPLDILKVLRESLGEYNFAGQYQQSPAPLGGGLIKAGWLKPYSDASLPSEFDLTFQSWDTANKASELSDHSVCTTWGVKGKHLYLLHVYRKRIGFPDLKRAVRAQAESFGAKVVLIEDKASGTQLIQDLVGEGMHSIQRYDPTGNDKVSRLSWVTCTIENGFVHIPEKAEWLAEYVHELEIFPNGRFDDQVDSTSQALDWFANHSSNQTLGYIEFLKNQAKRIGPQMHSGGIPKERPCDKCNGIMSQPIPGGLRCQHCEAQWLHPDYQPRVPSFNRKDYFAGRFPSRRR